MAFVGFTVASASSDDFGPKTDLGDTMFVGDSITHGFQGKASWRFNFCKILIDNNIYFNEVGVNSGSHGTNFGTNKIYGNGVFQNVHSAVSGEHAYEIAGTKKKERVPNVDDGTASRLEGTSIKQWLNFDSDYTGNRHIGANVTPSTYFLLIGTNDLLGDNQPNVSADTKYEDTKRNLLGTQSENNVWSKEGDMDAIIDTMRKKSGDDVDIVVLTVPVWNGSSNNPKPEDAECVRQYNESLKDWAEWKGVKVVDINFGMIDVANETNPWKAWAGLFPDQLHPGPQGELIISGNVARGLGYAGRTAGQLRKGAAEFSNRLTTIPTITAGTSSSYNWDSADLSHGFTVEFTFAKDGGVGNGSEGGWDTTHNFSVSVGDGEHYGTLNINEAYIQWGGTKLFSMDTSTLTDSLRIAYVYGNNARNLPSGFYVWMDDQLIGELTSENDIRSGSAINGITITNSTAGDITLKDLSWDGSGSWAPFTTNTTNGNPTIAGSGTVSDYGKFPGKAENWASDTDLKKEPIAIGGDGQFISGRLSSEEMGGTVNSGRYNTVFMNGVGREKDLYITLSGSAAFNHYMGFHGSKPGAKINNTFAANGYLRVIDLSEEQTFGCFIGTTNNNAGISVDGDLYFEFSSPYATVTNGAGLDAAIAGVYGANGGITGAFRVVINDGTFVSNIIGGSINGEASVGAVEFFLNGGFFTGNIAAGGYFGSVGDRSITISGDAVSFSVLTKLITAGAVPEGSNLFGTATPTGTVDGSATVTLADMTPEASFRQWKGTLSGGQETTDGVRTLVFAGVEMEGLDATLENFDVLVVTTSEYTKATSNVGLSDFGGATEIQVKEGSRLTLLAGEDGEAEYGDTLTVKNDGTIALPKGVTLQMNTEYYDAPNGSAWEVDGGKLILGDDVVGKHHVTMTEAAELEVGEVQGGDYTVKMSASAMTVAANAKGVYDLTMEEASVANVEGGSKYTVAMSSGSQLNVNGGDAKYTVEMSDSAMTVAENTQGIYDLTVKDASTVNVNGGDAEYTVEMSGGSELNVNGGEGDYKVEMSGSAMTVAEKTQGTYDLKMSGGSELNVNGGEGDYTVKAADAGNKVIVGDNVSGSFDLSMGDDSVLELGKNTQLTAAGSAKMGKDSIVTVGDSSEGDWTMELGTGSELTVGAGVTGNYTITLTGGGYIDSSSSSITGVAVLDGEGVYDMKGGLAAGLKLTLTDVTAETHVNNLGSSDVTLSGENRITLSSSMQTADGAPLDTTGKLLLDKDATLSINVNSIAADVQQQREGAYYLTHGDLSELSTAEAAGKLVFDATAVVLGWEIAYRTDGAIYFHVPGKEEESDIYQSSVDNDGENWGKKPGKSIYETVPAYKAILLDRATSLDLSNEEAPAGVTSLVMHNLVGSTGGSLTVQDTNAAHSSKLTISNSISEKDKELLKELSGGMEIEDSLTFAGNITLSQVGLEVKHETPDKPADGAAVGAPESRFIVKGNLVMEGDRDVELTCGVLELRGKGNDLGQGNVIFNGAEGQLAIMGSKAYVTLGGAVELAPDTEATEREHILLSGGATLELREGAKVGQGIVIGNAAEPGANPAGTLVVSGAATVASESKLWNVALSVEEHGVLHVADPVPQERALSNELDWKVLGLEGCGKMTANGADMAITATGSDYVFGGDLSAYAGTITIKASKYSQEFSGKGLKGNSAWNLTNEAGGRLTLNLAASDNKLTMGMLDLQSESHTSLLFDLTKMTEWSGLQLTQLNIEQNAHVTIGQMEGLIVLEGEKGEEVTIATIKVNDPAASDVASAGVDWQLLNIKNDDGNVYTEYDSAAGVLYLKTRVREEEPNSYLEFAQSENAKAGAQLLGGVNSAKIGGDLAGVDVAVAQLLRGENGKIAANVAEANRILAAVAGSSTAVLGQAVAGDVERQLRAIRNRTTGFSVSSETEASMWFNAESDYHKMEADGMLPGYKVNSWGGTVGASHSVGRNVEVGLALTAMYADLESEGPDRLKGDMDTYYVSAYAQIVRGAWRHTLVATVGTASIDAKRTVSYGDGSYTTSGSTDGTSFGALYEVGYSIPLYTDGSMCLQPVANVAVRHSTLDAYTESGSTAALDVDSQKNTVVTLGFGARLQAALDGSFWNRTSYFEGRALVKVDCGDSYGESRVALHEVGATHGTVRSVDRGSVGVELGAGLTVPVGDGGEVFMDVSAELWSGYTNVNAAVGYKVEF